jgi:tetratricopeptide (TPR) repeat protein
MDQPSASDLVNRLLDLESERHWLYEDPIAQRLYKPTRDAFGDLAQGDCAVVETAVAAATLVGAPTLWAAVQTMTRALEVDQARARNIACWLHSLYPPMNTASEVGWLPPLQPDLLGEELVARVIRRQLAEGTPPDQLLPCRILSGGVQSLAPVQVHRLLIVMIRVGSRHRDLADLLANAMRTLMREESGGLAAAATWDHYCQAVVAQYGHAKEPGWPPVVLWLSDRARECLAGESEENLLSAEAADIELHCATDYLRCYHADRGREDLLRASIHDLRTLSDRLPDGHEIKPKALTNLGSALGNRYRSAFAHPADLDDAVAAGLRAVALSDPSDAWYASRINNLGGARYSRYLRDGAIGDLRKSIEDQQKLLDEHLMPTDHRAMLTNNLAEALRQMFEVTGDRAILRKAQRTHRQAVHLARQAPTTDLARILCDTGETIRTWRATLHGTREAIKLQQEALDLTNPGNIEWPYRLAKMAWSWRILASWLKGEAALGAASRAVMLFGQALEAIPEMAPERKTALRGQAEAIEQRWLQTRDPNDLQTALAGYSATLDSAVRGSPTDIYSAAHSAARLAAEAGDITAALVFFERGLSVVERLQATQTTDEDKEYILRRAEDLVKDASAAYSHTGQPEKAAATLNKYALRPQSGLES